MVQIWQGLMSPDLHTNSPGHFFFFWNHNWQTLTCTCQSSTYSPNQSRREGGGCGFTLSRSHSCCAMRLVYTQISPGHIWTTLYVVAMKTIPILEQFWYGEHLRKNRQTTNLSVDYEYWPLMHELISTIISFLTLHSLSALFTNSLTYGLSVA